MQTSFARLNRTSRITWPAGLLAALALTATLRAQDMRDLVGAALDQKITARIEISERPIREALHEVEKTTGLRFVLHETAIEWMPYGDQTRIAIVMEDISVRRALGRIFDGLGLSLRVVDDKVLVEPAPVLDRLGRRLTVDEVELLQKLAGKPWSAFGPGEIAVSFAMPPEPGLRDMLDQALREAPVGNALAQLDAVMPRLGWLWIPTDNKVIIYSRSEDIQQRLDRPLNFHLRRVPLDEVLIYLGQVIDITIHFEPGALQRVAARDREVDLIRRGMSVRQVLELLVGRTGLWYEVVEDGIMVGAVPPEGEPTGEHQPRVVAILRIPVGDDGTTIDFLLREDELPPEFKELFERKLPAVIELLRERAGDRPR
ncbi:MAG: hypothetical protein KAY37_02025 [Phycisphaerae bacterium]|nr:hypothetical protein [Phycisphaerae bacterium]